MGKGCIVIGAAMLDIVMEIDKIPKSGTDVYAKGQTMMVGGCAYVVCSGWNRNVCRFYPKRIRKSRA